MKTIRQGVFETNSSSSHSVTICPDNDLLVGTIAPCKCDGEIVLGGGEFGWEWARYNDALTKANYIAIHEGARDLLEEVIKEHTGWPVRYEVTGYIDHQSEHNIDNILTDKEVMRKFVFSPNSWLFTGNDNSPMPVNHRDPDADKYPYALTLEGTKSIYKLKANQIKDKGLIQSALRTLYPEHPDSEESVSQIFGNDYSRERTAWVEDNAYQLSWWNHTEKEGPIDFKEKTLRVSIWKTHYKPVKAENGREYNEFDRREEVKSKLLKFKITRVLIDDAVVKAVKKLSKKAKALKKIKKGKKK